MSGMLDGRTVAVVVPAYNEETQIGRVIDTMPSFVDRIVVVDDCSTDRTREEIQRRLEPGAISELHLKRTQGCSDDSPYNQALRVCEEQRKEEERRLPKFSLIETTPDKSRLVYISLGENSGVGAAIAVGYKWCKDRNVDCTAVMAGDGQMDPSELESICLPIVEGAADYVKGNRLNHKSAWSVIPRTRFIGNSILSILTKIASGYWHVSDTQCGYTAISARGLDRIRLDKVYPRYGVPNDLLVKLNIASCTMKEVDIKPVYNVGEQSKMKVMTVIPRMSLLLIGLFLERLWLKYLLKDFHPLFVLYNLSFLLLALAVPYGYKISYLWITHAKPINPLTILAFFFLFVSGFQFLLFAMWMDIQNGERLHPNA